MSANLIDALAAGPLAAKVNAPIILTEGNVLTKNAKDQLTRLKVKKVYVTSGTAVIKQSVLDELKTIATVTEVKSLGGYDASETSVNIAKAMVEHGANIDKVVITGGAGSDALSIAPIAGAQGMPILYTSGGSLSSYVLTYLDGIKSNLKETYVIGGTAVVSEAVKTQIPGIVVRYYGQTQYDTNIEVLKQFAGVLKNQNTYVANGETLVEALAGARLAVKNNSLILLTGKTLPEASKKYAQSNLSSNVIGLGGESVVPARVLSELSPTEIISLDGSKVGSADAANLEQFNGSLKVTGNNVTVQNAKTDYSIYVQGDNVTLNNVTVQGTIFLDPGDKGSATLQNVKATNIVILSGADHSINLKDVIAQLLNIQSSSPNVHVDASGSTTFTQTQSSSTAIFEASDGSHFGTISITYSSQSSGAAPIIELRGTFPDTIEVGGGVTVIAAPGSNISNLAIMSDDPSQTVTLQGNFNAVEVNSQANVTLGANTTITNVVANALANIVVPPSSAITHLDAGSTGTTPTGGGSVGGTTSPVVTPTPTPSGGSSGSGNGSGSGSGSGSRETVVVSDIMVTGNAIVGSTLTAAPTPANATVSYQWQRADTADGTYTNISGATSSTYTFVTDDAGKYMKASATGTVSYSGTVTSDPQGPIEDLSGTDSAKPVVTTTRHNLFPTLGTTVVLTVEASSPDGGTLTYQWYTAAGGLKDDAQLISDATQKTYEIRSVTADDNGDYWVFVTNTKGNAKPISKRCDAYGVFPTAEVANYAVRIAPKKIVYKAGDLLDLTGLVLTDSASSKAYIAFEDFAVNGITTVKANGAALVMADTEVVITVDGKTVSQAITVTAPDAVINPAAIAGVIAPVNGATPVTTVTATDQYSAAVAWSPADVIFAANREYTATITLTPKAGYTLAGVPGNFFTVAGATTVTNAANSGVITAVFPATAPNPAIPLSSIGRIVGAARVGSELTSGSVLPIGANYSFQWQICNDVDGAYAEITGATTSKYTPVAGDTGKYIKVVATGVDSYSGTVTSDPIGPVDVENASTNEQYFSFDESTGTIIDYDPVGGLDLIIPSTIKGVTVTRIGAYSLQNNGLTSVTIPDSITSVGCQAFSGNSITSIIIPNNMTSIGEDAFSNMTSLASVTIPNSVTSIGDHALAYNYSLTSVTIPDSVTSIGAAAFSRNSLEEVTIPDGLTSIANATFEDNSLTNITIPANVTSIGEHAFAYNFLTSVSIPDTVTSIGDSAFKWNLLENVTIPNSLTTIGKSVFERNSLDSVTIPDSVISIGEWAFSDNQLTSVTIPNSVTSIGSWAFSRNGLTSVTIGSNVIIGDDLLTWDQSFRDTYQLGGPGTYIGTQHGTWTKVPVPGAVVTGLTGALQVGESTTATAISAEPGAGTWISSVPAVATVDGETGVVTALTAGTTTIEYTTSTSGNVNFQAIIVYAEAAADNPTIGVAQVGEADITPAEFTAAGVGETIAWISTDQTKATINETTGVITAVAVGDTVITYTVVEDATDRVVVRGRLGITVQAVPVTNPIAVSGIVVKQVGSVDPVLPGSTIGISGSVNLEFSATLEPANATNKTVIWSSSNPEVASIIQNGSNVIIHGLTVGEAKITVTSQAASNVSMVFKASVSL